MIPLRPTRRDSESVIPPASPSILSLLNDSLPSQFGHSGDADDYFNNDMSAANEGESEQGAVEVEAAQEMEAGHNRHRAKGSIDDDQAYEGRANKRVKRDPSAQTSTDGEPGADRDDDEKNALLLLSTAAAMPPPAQDYRRSSSYKTSQSKSASREPKPDEASDRGRRLSNEREERGAAELEPPPQRPVHQQHPQAHQNVPIEREPSPNPYSTDSPPNEEEAYAAPPAHHHQPQQQPHPSHDHHNGQQQAQHDQRHAGSSTAAGDDGREARPARPARAWEPSLFGVEPIDEFTREVADWLWRFCSELDPKDVEIEAKIGLLVDRRTGQRIQSSNPIESILTDDSNLRFTSDVNLAQHKHFNGMLNHIVESRARPSGSGPSLAPVHYAHTRQIDSFHPATTGGGKIRVTRDAKDGTVSNVLEKIRMADMNICSPNRRFDFRISVNLERNVGLPQVESIHSRYKDRITYSHQAIQIDLTKVSTSASQEKTDSDTYELEVEFKDTQHLLAEARREKQGDGGGRYLEMVQEFLNNIRLLIRNAI